MSDAELERLACAAAYRSAGRAWLNLLDPDFDADESSFPYEHVEDICQLADLFFAEIEGMLVLPVPDVGE